MKSLVTAIAVGKIDGELVVDLSGIEDKAGDSDLPIAITWFNEEISLLQFDGEMTLEEMNESIDNAIAAMRQIYDLQLQSLKQKYLEIQESVNQQSIENNKGGES